MIASSLNDLLLDLNLTFPGINAQALPDEPTALFNGPKGWFDQQVAMPDMCPIFLLPDQLEGRDVPGYPNRIHEGFVVWLARRGWQVFRWPVEGAPAVHLFVPTATLVAAADRHEVDAQAAWRRASEVATAGDDHGA